MRHPSFKIVVCTVVGLVLTACGVQEGKVEPTVTSVPFEATAAPTMTREPSATPTQTLTATPTLVPTPAVTPTPFITAPAAGETVDVPILMYHHLKYREPGDSELLKTWSVAPDQFAAQLDYLQGRGFHTITFKQLVEFFEEGAALPTMPILLTFDDGWLDHYTVAFPELKKRGMVGNFFIPTQYADAGGELLVGWDQVVEMDRAGNEIGGHTINHEDLTTVSLEEMLRQLNNSKAHMEAKLGHPTYALSYPFGAFNARVMEETGLAGYRAAVILCCGYKQSADILLALPRIRVSYEDTIEDIADRLP